MTESQAATDAESFQDAEEQTSQLNVITSESSSSNVDDTKETQDSDLQEPQSSPSKNITEDLEEEKELTGQLHSEDAENTSDKILPLVTNDEDNKDVSVDIDDQIVDVESSMKHKNDDDDDEKENEEEESQSLQDQTMLSSSHEGAISESTQSMDVISTEDSQILSTQSNKSNHGTVEESQFISTPITKDEEFLFEEPASTHHQKNPFVEEGSVSQTVDQFKTAPPPLPERGSNPTSPTLPPRHVFSINDNTSKMTSTPILPPLPARNDTKLDPAGFLPPPLPPQLTSSQKQQHRPNLFQGWFQRSSVSASKESLSEKSIGYEENYDFLLNRLSENSEELKLIDEVSRDQLNTSHMELRSTFAERVFEIEKGESSIKSTSFISTDNTELNEIDWPFWTQVVNDYPSVVKTEPAKLSKELSGGIPSQVRGIVWQLVSNSNTKEFQDIYEDLLTKDSKFEKNIVKDLSRTSFMADYNIDQESVRRIIKAYSILDTQVGYTQGMAFITVPLLMNLDEVESFALLHKLMYGYNIRSLYLPDMPGLLLKLYQFDRLVEDNLPKLHIHFKRQGVQSSMFASQWFLTFFAYKFPLEFVLRIFDIVITEGFESLLKFAIALVQKNETKLLTLRFDDLIDFLKDSLFNSYLSNPVLEDDADEEDGEIANSTGLGRMFRKKENVVPITVDTYDVNSLVQDAMNVKIPPITLRRYEEEYIEIHRVEKERREEVEEIKTRNNQLRKEVRKLEASYTLLNREHVQIANEMINGRVKIATLEDENNELKDHTEVLKARIRVLQNPSGDNIPVPVNLEEDLKKTMQRNLEVMSKNQELEDQLLAMMVELDRLRAENERLQTTVASTSAAAAAAAEQESPRRQSKGWAPKIFGK